MLLPAAKALETWGSPEVTKNRDRTRREDRGPPLPTVCFFTYRQTDENPKMYEKNELHFVHELNLPCKFMNCCLRQAA